MTISTINQYWTSRMNGEDPTAITGQNNTAFTATGTGGSVIGDEYVVTNQTFSLTPSITDVTIVACFSYGTTDPDNGTVLMALDNGTHRVELQATGNVQTLKLVGTTTEQTRYLDLQQNDTFDPVPLIARLTLDSSGKARLYLREQVTDGLGANSYYEVTGSASTSEGVTWGNTSGTVKWANVFVSTFGAFSPDEMATSPFVTDTLIRMGLGVVQTLKDSKRFYLKNFVSDSSIVYGYDISSQMISRIPPPSIHVILTKTDSPTFTALGGTKVDQMFTVTMFITTRGTDYEEAYRTGASILGDSFDELYTTTGLKGNTDSLIDFTVNFDTKRDDDEVVCVHRLEMTYMRRTNMHHR